MTNTNEYGALIRVPEWALLLMQELEQAGAWTTGIEHVGSRGGFQAVNIACYAADDARELAVVQVREAFKRKASHWLRVRKNYFLIGRNENGRAFAHAIPSPRRFTADAVEFALCSIWRCTPRQLERVVRNGDVGFVPARRPADLEPIDFPVALAESHLVRGRLFFSPSRGELYAEGEAEIRHLKEQHAPARISSGFYAVRAGFRAATWNFSRQTAD
jgi:hypothetical protein